MTVAEKTVSADGTEIAFDRVGDGPALIIVGGAWNTRQSGAELAERLADSFTVYTYDRRGRGDSGDTPPYAVEREIDDLEAVIQAAGGSAALFGHSSGGALALAADYVEHLDELVATGKRQEVIPYFMTEAVGMPAEIVEQMIGPPMIEAMEPIAHTVGYDGRVMLRGSMHGEPLPAEWRDSITVPTLVMDGGISPEWLHSSARALVALLPDVSYRTLEGQDHAASTDALTPVLEDFLS
jgi:pimeloyl-ACP methyl ester carboxylesterase